MTIKYSFTYSQPYPGTPKAAEKLVDYPYSEFLVRLPEHWRQIPTSEDTQFNWRSETEKAEITISAHLAQVPEAKFQKGAEVALAARHHSMEELSNGRVEVLVQNIKPHSQGGALEITYAAQIPDHTHMYLGYVTSRKLFNFGLTCGPDKFAAADLFNKFMRERLRVNVP